MVVIKPELEVCLPGILGDVGRLPELRRERRVANVLAKDPWSWGFRRWASVLPNIVATAPARVVAMASTILLVPFACVENTARIVVIANAV
jgi:hypothetical protein